MESSVKLYSIKVHDVPKELNKEKIENIFSEFGDVIDCSVEETWATLQFASKMEAATAIARLDRQPPFNLSVDWAISQKEKGNGKTFGGRGDRGRVSAISSRGSVGSMGRGMSNRGRSLDSHNSRELVDSNTVPEPNSQSILKMTVPSQKAKLTPKITKQTKVEFGREPLSGNQAKANFKDVNVTTSRDSVDSVQPASKPILTSTNPVQVLTSSTAIIDQVPTVRCSLTSTPSDHIQRSTTGADVLKCRTSPTFIDHKKGKKHITISKEGIKFIPNSATSPIKSLTTATDVTQCPPASTPTVTDAVRCMSNLSLSTDAKQNLSMRFSATEKITAMEVSSCSIGAKIRNSVKLTAPRPIKQKSLTQATPDTPMLKESVNGNDASAKQIIPKSKASSSSHLVQNNPEERRIQVSPVQDCLSSKKNVVEGTFKKTPEIDLNKLLNPDVLYAIKRCGLIHPSAIQKECLPIACIGNDVVCQAKSGTGKTLVFILSTLQQISPRDGEISTLIMCTTRELAMQIGKEFNELLEFIPNIKIGIFVGGSPVETDKKILKENCPHIVVGTPGRILDLVSSKSLPLENIKHFILDECDKMLENLEMRQDVQMVFIKTPRVKQVMMFSATFSDDIKSVCRKFTNNPREFYIADDAKLALKKLQQFSILTQETKKKEELLKLLNLLDYNRVFIFVNMVMKCDDIASFLISKNYGAKPIHGGMPQQERTANYKEFENLSKRILVATNVFSRGMDITEGNIVINYDMPETTDDYLHRVGRAGRFETKGLAISFVKRGGDEVILNQVQDRFNVKILPFTGDGFLF